MLSYVDIMSRTDTLIAFLKEIEKYKTVERAIWKSDGKKESDAEHSWHLAMMLILLEKELPLIDFKRAMKLALMHDLVEIYAGDTLATDKEGRKTKAARETAAAKLLFTQLPPDLHEEFMNLFLEYEEARTREAKTVKALDKLQPILQNLCSEGKTWTEHDEGIAHLDRYTRKHVQHDPFLNDLYESLFSEAKEIMARQKT